MGNGGALLFRAVRSTPYLGKIASDSQKNLSVSEKNVPDLPIRP